MSDDVLKLAYEAACSALREQDATLTSLRNRATALLSAAAVVTSVATAIGVVDTGTGQAAMLPVWAGWTLLALVCLIGASSMFALWPAANWNFGPDPAKLLASAGNDVDEVRRIATKALVSAITINDASIATRGKAYRVGAALLLAEMIVLVAAALTGGG